MALHESKAPRDGSKEVDNRCFLLELPAELRLHIYELLLLPDSIRVFSFDNPSILDLPEDVAPTARFYAEVRGNSVCPQLLRACSQLHDEARILLDEPKALHLAPSLGGDGGSYGPKLQRRQFSINRLASIRKVSELPLGLPTCIRTLQDDVAHSRVLANHLRGGLHTAMLFLDIDLYGSEEVTLAEGKCAVWEAIEEISGSFLAKIHASRCEIAISVEGESVLRREKGIDGNWENEDPEEDDIVDSVRELLSDGYFERMFDTVSNKVSFTTGQAVPGRVAR
ncbi:hypothetical protein LTR37_012730 [Vermiconidia calcicola]|uniref:Uncharacterized protein n=1 Tax=Vermiconidia calcicola TaxID=1690605 RepID=A0ACC3MZ95_9PEZI|nr:hypothetical protein LTR37_012730 [Vermiconidia calcicola]